MKGIISTPAPHMLTITPERHFEIRWELPLDSSGIMAQYVGPDSCQGFPPLLELEELSRTNEIMITQNRKNVKNYQTILEREGLKFPIKKLKRKVLPGIFEIKGSQNHQY
jgi:hypothetical protein